MYIRIGKSALPDTHNARGMQHLRMSVYIRLSMSACLIHFNSGTQIFPKHTTGILYSNGYSL